MMYPLVSTQADQTHNLKLSCTEPTTNRLLYGNRTFRGNIDNLSLTVKKIIQLNNYLQLSFLYLFKPIGMEIQFNLNLYLISILADLEEEPGSSPFEPISVEDMPPVAIDVRFVLYYF